ncbi:MAG: hypothetical protein RLZZ140_177, partial [Pseudomonadota bacterium]
GTLLGAALGTSGEPCITLPAPSGTLFLVAIQDRPRVATKNIAASIAVTRLRKFALPVDPNTLPAEPEPNATLALLE